MSTVENSVSCSLRGMCAGSHDRTLVCCLRLPQLPQLPFHEAIEAPSMTHSAMASRRSWNRFAPARSDTVLLTHAGQFAAWRRLMHVNQQLAVLASLPSAPSPPGQTSPDNSSLVPPPPPPAQAAALSAATRAADQYWTNAAFHAALGDDTAETRSTEGDASPAPASQDASVSPNRPAKRVHFDGSRSPEPDAPRVEEEQEVAAAVQQRRQRRQALAASQTGQTAAAAAVAEPVVEAAVSEPSDDDQTAPVRIPRLAVHLLHECALEGAVISQHLGCSLTSGWYSDWERMDGTGAGVHRAWTGSQARARFWCRHITGSPCPGRRGVSRSDGQGGAMG
jgi:hypothetical protein